MCTKPRRAVPPDRSLPVVISPRTQFVTLPAAELQLACATRGAVDGVLLRGATARYYVLLLVTPWI